MWQIEFTSAEFLPRLPESCQGNPGVYGFELAWWLAQALAEQGIVTSYPLGEVRVHPASHLAGTAFEGRFVPGARAAARASHHGGVAGEGY